MSKIYMSESDIEKFKNRDEKAVLKFFDSYRGFTAHTCRAIAAAWGMEMHPTEVDEIVQRVMIDIILNGIEKL